MITLKRQVIAAISAGSMLISVVSPAFAATDITVTGNGAYSENEVEVDVNHSTQVVQTNTAIVTNTVSSTSSTGGNDANQNTNGDVLVKTGDAKTSTTIENLLNSNKAVVDCCNVSDTEIKISGNGAYSDNDIDMAGKQSVKSEIYIPQTNVANVTNHVDTDAKTGANDANQNTGGSVLVSTGDAKTEVNVSTTANQNEAVVGGNSADPANTSMLIVGNGYKSENEIEADLKNSIQVVQTNVATVLNQVDADAKTGYNDANQNTGGEVAVLTGDAKSKVDVDTAVNFNWADVNCGCISGFSAKIGENGADTDNKIEVGLDDVLFVPQTNMAVVEGLLDGEAKTGKNDVDQNTGDPGSDPTVWTGDSESAVAVSTSGNSNSYGAENNVHEWPTFDFSFSFNLSDLLAFLGH